MHGSVHGACMGAVSTPGSLDGDSSHARECAKKLGVCKGVCVGTQKKHTVKEPVDGSVHSSARRAADRARQHAAQQRAGSVPRRPSKHTTAARKAQTEGETCETRGRKTESCFAGRFFLKRRKKKEVAVLPFLNAVMGQRQSNEYPEVTEVILLHWSPSKRDCDFPGLSLWKMI